MNSAVNKSPESHSGKARVWLDISTLAKAMERPGGRVSGIPRVVSELALVAQGRARQGASISLVRYDPLLPGFREVGFDALDELLARTSLPPSRLPSIRDIIRRLAPDLVKDLIQLEKRVKRPLVAARAKIRNFAQHGADAARGVSHPFAPGDCWINFGSWWHSGTLEAMQKLKAAGTDIHCSILIHDCIPLIYPEYFRAEDSALWRDALPGLAPVADTILANSNSTAQDIEEAIPACKGRVRTITFGDSFELSRPQADEAGKMLAALGVREPYVLMVGTLEVRKNHVLAFRAWRNLLRHKVPGLPKLVFAGRWGWKTADLRDEIETSDYLGGQLQIIDGPSDAQLSALYSGAMFTLFPSHYEGWGLPVRESFAFGKLCLASRNSALPEAGGEWAEFFENNCQTDLERKLIELVTTTGALTRAEERIANGFRPVDWNECLDQAIAASAGQ